MFHLAKVPSSLVIKHKIPIAALLPVSSSMTGYFPFSQPQFVLGWAVLQLIVLLAKNYNSIFKNL